MFTGPGFFDGCERGVGIHMAAAGAVPQLADGIFSVWLLDLLMRTSFVVIGMTTGAVRLVSTELPSDHLVVRGMTVIAANIGPVAGREQRRVMGVIEYGEPLVGAVTSITRA